MTSDQGFSPREVEQEVADKVDQSAPGKAAERLRIGVHVLTEFVFCPRSGLIAYEEGLADTGEEPEEMPRLDFLPDYNLIMIQEALSTTWREIWRFLTFAPPIILAIALVGMFIDGWIALVMAFSCLFFIPWIIRQGKAIVTLSQRLHAAESMTPAEPDPALGWVQDVNWWSLIKAGFESMVCRESYCDESLGLAGRPWRLLCRGSLRIPVFRKRKGDKRLFPQHHVRMAAYRHLIQVSEGAEVPFSVVLFGYGYDGVALFSDQQDHQQMLSSIDTARGLLEMATKKRILPDEPSNTVVCRKCLCGQPRRYWRGKTETLVRGELAKPFLTRGEDRRVYHSTCGDRFQWVPPHDEAFENKLV